MLSVSIIIPAWNEEEHIADCLTCAMRQTVPAKEILVVDNKSTDKTVEIVTRFIADHPDAHIRLLHQDAEQGLIPTRNYGLNRATGDILGRVDSDSMLRPDWVEQATRIFAAHPDVMGATGPVAYYDMPAARVSLRGDNIIRRHIYRADGGQTLLFGSNMALRAMAWRIIAHEVCRDKADVMHEDIDVSLHLFSHDFRTYYSRHLVVGISARRMDTSFKSFSNYMDRFHNTFAAHPSHTRTTKPEILLTAMYPWLHMMYPGYQRYLRQTDTNPAKKVWEKQQLQLALQGDLDLDGGDSATGPDARDEDALDDEDSLDEQTAMDSLSPLAAQTNSFFADLFRPSPETLEKRRQKRAIREQKSALREESKQIRADLKVAKQKIRAEKKLTTRSIKARSKKVKRKIHELNKKSSRI